LVVVKPGCELSESELIEFCRSGLAHFKCPRSIEFVEALPKTATGKILKKNLRKKYWSAQNNVSPEFAPRK
jgi:fatty-acyl-CoA synthase